MRRWTPTAAAALTIVIAAAHAEDGIVRLHAAGSLKPALTEVAHGFTVAYGIRIDPVWGPSGLLRERFERGEAGDVFASADMASPLALAKAGKAGPGRW